MKAQNINWLIIEMVLFVTPVTLVYFIFLPFSYLLIVKLLFYSGFKDLEFVFNVAVLSIGLWSLISLWHIGIKYAMRGEKQSVSQIWWVRFYVGFVVVFMGLFTNFFHVIQNLTIFLPPLIPATHILMKRRRFNKTSNNSFEKDAGAKAPHLSS